MANKEILDWYNRVMHWTYRNRSAYIKIVLIQMFITLVLLSFSAFFVYRLMQNEEDHTDVSGPYMPTMSIITMMLMFDVFCFNCDILLIRMKWRLMISIRQIFCAVSVSLGVIVIFSFQLSS